MESIDQLIRTFGESFFYALNSEELTDDEGKDWGWLAVRVPRDRAGKLVPQETACLVGKRWLLTARHNCVGLTDRFVVGVPNVDSASKEDIFTVVDICLPKGALQYCTSKTNWPDIALVKLDREVENREPIPLAGAQGEQEKTSGWQVGWGPWKASAGGVGIHYWDTRARKTPLLVQRTGSDPDKTLTVLFDYKAGSLCKGDSGSPLVIGSGKSLGLYGIVSEGNMCSKGGKKNLGKLTYLPYWAEWISERASS